MIRDFDFDFDSDLPDSVFSHFSFDQSTAFTLIIG